MSQITLELNNTEDENLLLSLLQRMGISFSITRKEVSDVKNSDYYRQIIEQGVKINDFEQRSQNKELPFKLVR